MLIDKFYIKGYKCFSDSTEFDAPSTVNLIIGRNNSGKSSFLDVLKHIYCPNYSMVYDEEGFSFKIDSSDLHFIYPVYDPLTPINHYNSPIPLLNKNELIEWELSYRLKKGRAFVVTQSSRFFTSKGGFRYSISRDGAPEEYVVLRKNDCVFVKAERNVVSEKSEHSIEVKADGDGLTSALKYHFSDKDGSRKLLESIRVKLNEILEGEDCFSALRVLSSGDYSSIVLENSHGEISIDDMGSGLKTLLLVLFRIKKEEFNPTDSIFMFEELENNLHPEIQRRLFNTIYDFAIKNKKMVFITSHSHVAINCFYGKPETRIYHIEKESDKSSSIETVDSDLSKGEILEDLGVKASDIFQSNGIIWVEGPSDRVYINKWLKLVNPNLKEGVDYTFLYYGGRLLAHYTGQKQKDMVDILLTNRNSAIVIDSDKKKRTDTINNTKTRIVNDFATLNRFCWVTKGREIENYIHEGVINSKYRSNSTNKYKRIGQYKDFKDYIETDDPTFESHKVEMANGLTFDDNSLNILDLRKKIKELSIEIEKWNH